MTVSVTLPALPVLVERSKRFGHDRAYVRLGDEQVGYRDLLTGEVCCSARVSVERQAVIRSATDHLVHPPSAYTPRHASTSREQAMAQRTQAPLRTLVARLVGSRTDERAWRIGADAERRAGNDLTALGEGWYALHAVPVGERGSDIDRLVIGPAGVFSVTAKHHPDSRVWAAGDSFLLNGHYQPYVRNSREEAQRAAGLLGARLHRAVAVHAVIAVTGADRGFVVKEQPRDGLVTILRNDDLSAYLRLLPELLSRAEVERTFAAARQLPTWQPETATRAEFAR